MEKFPFVSIVVSNYNGWKLNVLSSCLESLFKLDYPAYEVILVDNCSTDGSVDEVEKLFGSNAKLKIIRHGENRYSKGLNEGAKASRGKYVVYFNNDIVANPAYLKEAIDVFEERDDVAILQGKLLSYFDHSKIDSIGETMDLFGNPITIGWGESDAGQYEKPMEILSASGSASIVRKSLFDEIGYFGEEYFIGYEDMDLSLRARLKGYKVLYTPKAIVYHMRGVTDLSDELRVRVRWHFNKNRIMTMVKNYSIGSLFKALPVTIMIYLLTFIWESIIKKNPRLGWTRVTAILWNLKKLGVICKERARIQSGLRTTTVKEIMSLMPQKTLLNNFRNFVKI